MSNCDHEYFHIVFSTKFRFPWIPSSLQEQCWSYMGGIIKNLGAIPLQVGGMEDHVHILVKIPITVSRVQLIRTLKSSSTQWLQKKLPDGDAFRWQISYGNFSVSPQHVEKVRGYIKNQPKHHKGVTYKGEYTSMLKECNAEYDEHKIWD